MSHTLHRPRCTKTSANDFVVLVMPARGKNNTDVSERYAKYVDVFKKYNATNMGGMDIGILVGQQADDLKKTLDPMAPMIHAVYDNAEDLKGCLKELKEKEYGFSVVVSGKLDEVRKAAGEVGVKPHSFHYSLGVWGRKEVLPDETIRELTSMCGHSMVSGGLVLKLVAQIKSGKKSARKVAEQLAMPCVCGIFNVNRAELLLQALADK